MDYVEKTFGKVAEFVCRVYDDEKEMMGLFCE